MTWTMGPALVGRGTKTESNTMVHIVHTERFRIADLLYWLWDSPSLVNALPGTTLCGEVYILYRYSSTNRLTWTNCVPFIQVTAVFGSPGECTTCSLLKLQIEAGGIDVDNHRQ